MKKNIKVSQSKLAFLNYHLKNKLRKKILNSIGEHTRVFNFWELNMYCMDARHNQWLFQDRDMKQLHIPWPSASPLVYLRNDLKCKWKLAHTILLQPDSIASRRRTYFCSFQSGNISFQHKSNYKASLNLKVQLSSKKA